ncbi:hypothetical protein [Halobacillus sp. A5]|uniref:hypothetical protein n=1 Tax=Halobacillus sp. A5 TaxID=2880263 RepID=UPI0020A64DFC|nr:hypothetical protein [Halobacillus sp. A5]MCP3026863.1 hypothetical protein [Halobacillus sp. A5]
MEVNEVVNVLVEQNKHFKDMVWLAVGGILTIVAAAFIIFGFMFRSFKKGEVESLQREIESNIQNEYIEKIKEELEEFAHRKIEGLSKNLQEDIGSLKGIMNHTQRTIKEREESLSELIRSLEANIYILEGDLWEQREIFSNSINRYVDAGFIYQEIDKDQHNFLLDHIDKWLDKNSYLDFYHKKRLQDYLDNLSSDYSKMAEKLTKKVLERKN